MFLRSVLNLFASVVCAASWGCVDADDGNGRDDRDSQNTNDTAPTSTDDDTDAASDRTSDVDTELGTLPPETAYEGFEELYILTADDDPVDICRIRYELLAVAEPAVPCTICEWDVVLEKQNPTVVTNVAGACEHSDLALDGDAIAAQVGERIAYGFAAESVGHANLLMRYNPVAGKWEEYTVSNWDPIDARLRYKRRDGICAYAEEGETAPSTSGICGISGEATVTGPVNDDAR